MKRFPQWLKRSIVLDSSVDEIKNLLRSLKISTVCESARCPNIYDCFSRHRCTFLILGRSCTRRCGFCSIEDYGDFLQPDESEPLRIKEIVEKLSFNEVVITSVTRDDLEDGGAGQFADCIKILREANRHLYIEVLVPDFLGRTDAIEKVVYAGPDVFAHNLDTVPRLYKEIKPHAIYKRSLDVLGYVKKIRPEMTTKSGLMVGLGERYEEIYAVMRDLRDVGCDAITIGQYLKPDSGCKDVVDFVPPEDFLRFSKFAEELGFKDIVCSPFARSSYKNR